MLTPDQFDFLIDRLMATGLTEQQACYFAPLIGDSTELDSAGNIVVRHPNGERLRAFPIAILEGGLPGQQP